MNDRLETYPNNPLYQLQQCVKERLEADPWFAEHGVRLMLMDDGEIANLIRREVGVLEGPVLVVAIAEVEGNAPDVTAGDTATLRIVCDGSDSPLYVGDVEI